MRTTLSLDDDVGHSLQKEMRRSGASLKETVNRLLRLGLMVSQQQPAKPFVVVPHRLGLPPGTSYDNVAELLENLEGTTHR